MDSRKESLSRRAYPVQSSLWNLARCTGKRSRRIGWLWPLDPMKCESGIRESCKSKTFRDCFIYDPSIGGSPAPQVAPRSSSLRWVLRFNRARQVDASKMFPPPNANRFQRRDERHSIIRNRVANTRRHTPVFVPQKNTVRHQLLQMPNQHSFRNSRDAAAQFAGPHRAVQ